jgi:hypothetical protein
LKVLLSTPVNSVLLHPSFGAGISPGTSVADFNASAIYTQIESLIKADPRFAGLQKLQVRVQGPTMQISLAVQIANQQGIFPIAFAIT